MPARNSPQFRFLLRGSLLVIGFLTLWWMAALDPLLDGLRISTGAALHLLPGGPTTGAEEDSRGDWVLQVPVPGFISNSENVQSMFSAAVRPVKIPSLKIAVARAVPILFTLIFPLFWAASLAGPLNGNTWKRVLIGTAVCLVISVGNLIVYSIYMIDKNLHYSAGTLNAMINFVEYLNMYVVPYAAPLLLALTLNAELREQIFTGETA